MKNMELDEHCFIPENEDSKVIFDEEDRIDEYYRMEYEKQLYLARRRKASSDRKNLISKVR